MKIQYCSDHHLEFLENETYLRSNRIKPVGEITLLAGDIVMLSVLKKYDCFLITSLPISKPRIGFKAIMSTTSMIFHFGVEVFVKM